MAGKPNTKWLETMTTKLGGKEHVSAFMSRIGGRGGSKQVPKGFALNRELASAAGKRGGLKSRRSKGMPTKSDWELA